MSKSIQVSQGETIDYSFTAPDSATSGAVSLKQYTTTDAVATDTPVRSGSAFIGYIDTTGIEPGDYTLIAQFTDGSSTYDAWQRVSVGASY